MRVSLTHFHSVLYWSEWSRICCLQRTIIRCCEGIEKLYGYISTKRAKNAKKNTYTHTRKREKINVSFFCSPFSCFPSILCLGSNEIPCLYMLQHTYSPFEWHTHTHTSNLHLKCSGIEPGEPYIRHYPLLYYPSTLELGLWQTYKLFSFFFVFGVRFTPSELYSISCVVFFGAMRKRRRWSSSSGNEYHERNGEGCFKRLLDYHWCEYNIHYVLKYMCSQFLFVFRLILCFLTFHQKSCTAKRRWHFYTDIVLNWIPAKKRERENNTCTPRYMWFHLITDVK